MAYICTRHFHGFRLYAHSNMKSFIKLNDVWISHFFTSILHNVFCFSRIKFAILTCAQHNGNFSSRIVHSKLSSLESSKGLRELGLQYILCNVYCIKFRLYMFTNNDKTLLSADPAKLLLWPVIFWLQFRNISRYWRSEWKLHLHNGSTFCYLFSICILHITIYQERYYDAARHVHAYN